LQQAAKWLGTVNEDAGGRRDTVNADRVFDEVEAGLHQRGVGWVPVDDVHFLRREPDPS
jgi:hypothetical protein